MLEDFSVAQLEEDLVGELEVRLGLMQRRHETAAGGLFFHCEIANENIEKSVSAEIGAGGWAVEGVSLRGYMRATMDVERSLMLLGACGARLVG